MKKKIGIVILATMMATLVACGNDSKTGSNETSTVAVNNETENNTQENTTDKKQEANADELSDEYLLSLPETSADQFRYEVLDDGNIAIKSYKGEVTEDTIVVIPAQIDGKNVTRIKGKVFFNTSVKAIVTGANVCTIDKEVFLSVKVQKLVINGPLSKIKEDTFMNSTIGEVSFSDKVEEIGVKSFANCHISSIRIPTTIKLIDDAAFGMSDLEEVYFEGGNATVRDLAFGSCSNLKKVYVPNCEIIFEDEAFYSSDNVVIVTPAGSSAEEYAKANGISFETLD